ncbi:polymeric immunoglobulin receptor isoform X3 [Ochotona curzoniae]|uniref:polymeric immunoglobulin receptor isoform X2 n=1 Tax=Ochotona curzoniae TaxID=130825 RepID=UPI001B347FB2|nr:polymeric immunoglobulin receptor isoform X2 [Ochotona curzoniae]XP_040841509.1 polymeric immunoglobulin receptor isoform X3 [Ochotona curzoniae]
MKLHNRKMGWLFLPCRSVPQATVGCPLSPRLVAAPCLSAARSSFCPSSSGVWAARLNKEILDQLCADSPQKSAWAVQPPQEPPAMTPLWFTCLLALFSVVTAHSSIFGPEEITVLEGSPVSIKCFYPNSSVNRHSRKFWCQPDKTGRCMTLISTDFISAAYKGKAKLTDFPEENSFVVEIDKVNQDDTGSYKCGVGVNDRGLDFTVSLHVNKDPGPDFYSADISGEVTVTCTFTPETRGKKKTFYKWIEGNRVPIIDTDGKVDSGYTGRITLNIESTTALEFTVTIIRLKVSDTGIYVCESGNQEHDVELRVSVSDPVLLYGNQKSSVIFDCDLNTSKKTVPVFLCHVKNETTCEVVVNSLGEVNPDFKGRVWLKSRNEGSFKVVVAGLKKEDSGDYLCGLHPTGAPTAGGWPVQYWRLFVNEEIPKTQISTVVKGVPGGSVTIRCPHNNENDHKYLCLWGKDGQSCQPLVDNEEEVEEEYEGRLRLIQEPGNGIFTVIITKLTEKDNGFYWCAAEDVNPLYTPVKVQVVKGKPGLTVVSESSGDTVTLSCKFPCKYYSYEKYWCKWSSQDCEALPTQEEDASDDVVNCRLISKVLSVNASDNGWYWCGVKQDQNYGEALAVHVPLEATVEDTVKVSQPKAKAEPLPAEEKVEPVVKEVDSKVLVKEVDSKVLAKEVDSKVVNNQVVANPKLLAEEAVVESAGDPASGSRASVESSSAQGQSGTSKVLLSTLVPLGLVLAVGAMAVAVARARHRRNVDRVSIGSYRTDISMSDLAGSRDFGAIENPAACPEARETSLEGKDEITITTESTVEIQEPKKAKRSSKEEADMAYSAFLLQSSAMATEHQDDPKEP